MFRIASITLELGTIVGDPGVPTPPNYRAPANLNINYEISSLAGKLSR